MMDTRNAREENRTGEDGMGDVRRALRCARLDVYRGSVCQNEYRLWRWCGLEYSGDDNDDGSSYYGKPLKGDSLIILHVHTRLKKIYLTILLLFPIERVGSVFLLARTISNHNIIQKRQTDDSFRYGAVRVCAQCTTGSVLESDRIFYLIAI